MAPVQVLHLVGSSESTWYFDLSVMYGRTCMGCPDLDSDKFVHQAVVIFPSGKWGFPSNLDDEHLKTSEKFGLSIGKAMAKIEALQPAVDVVVPHMFCVEGLTRYRALCDMLGIEVLGCSAESCALAQDKFQTKAVCETAGVPVPQGLLLRRGVHDVNLPVMAAQLLETQSVPFIVKPSKADNSFGLSLVKEASVDVIQTALSKAFEHDDAILVEEYIAGREVRVAVLEIGEGKAQILEILPKIEYKLEDIREQRHKYGTDSAGKLLTSDADPSKAFLAAKEEGERICPAQLEPEVHARVDELAKKAHVALGCKYYSLFDVRINTDGLPFMLEACLFCSFSPYSVIVSLAEKSTLDELQPHPKIFETMLRRAALETQARRTPGSDDRQ